MTVYQRETLSNGLRVLTAPLDHAQSVAVQELALLLIHAAYLPADRAEVPHPR